MGIGNGKDRKDRKLILPPYAKKNQKKYIYRKKWQNDLSKLSKVSIF